MDIALPELAAVAESVKPLLDWRGVPVDLASLAALAAGLGWASGLRLYALVFVLGALARYADVAEATLVPDDRPGTDRCLLEGRTLAEVVPRSPARAAIAALAAMLLRESVGVRR